MAGSAALAIDKAFTAQIFISGGTVADDIAIAEAGSAASS